MARRAYPLILVLWLLNGLLTPLIDLYIIGSLIVGEVSRTVLLWALIQLATLALVAVGFLLERESLKTLWALPLQFFGYRQILSAITISSLFVSIAGHAAGWRPLERSGTARIIDQPARPA